MVFPRRFSAVSGPVCRLQSSRNTWRECRALPTGHSRQSADSLQNSCNADGGDVGNDPARFVKCIEVHDGRGKLPVVRCQACEGVRSGEGSCASPLHCDRLFIGDHILKRPVYIRKAAPHEIHDTQISFRPVKRHGGKRRREYGGWRDQFLAKCKVICVDAGFKSPHCRAISLNSFRIRHYRLLLYFHSFCHPVSAIGRMADFPKIRQHLWKLWCNIVELLYLIACRLQVVKSTSSGADIAVSVESVWRCRTRKLS